VLQTWRGSWRGAPSDAIRGNRGFATGRIGGANACAACVSGPARPAFAKFHPKFRQGSLASRAEVQPLSLSTPIHPAPIRWAHTPPAAQADQAWPRPALALAVWRGLAGNCPCCGQTRLFTGWLRQSQACAHCDAPLGLVRADDAPPYFVIFLVAHIVIAAQVLIDASLALSTMAEAAVFLPITLALSLGLLRPVKGATIGLMLRLGMVAAADA
jgi:uncharacterized protein (DUF983 family)